MSALSDSDREREHIEAYYDSLYQYGMNARLHSWDSAQALANAQGAQIEENWWRRRLAVWTPAVVAAYRREPLPWRSKDPGASGPFSNPSEYFDMIYGISLQVALKRPIKPGYLANVLGRQADEAWWRARLRPWLSAVASADGKRLLAWGRENCPDVSRGEPT